MHELGLEFELARRESLAAFCYASSEVCGLGGSFFPLHRRSISQIHALSLFFSHPPWEIDSRLETGQRKRKPEPDDARLSEEQQTAAAAASHPRTHPVSPVNLRDRMGHDEEYRSNATADLCRLC